MLALVAEALILQLRAHCKFNVHPASKKGKPTTKKTHSLKEEMGFFSFLKTSISERNVVIHIREIRCRLRLRTCCRCRWRLARCLLAWLLWRRVVVVHAATAHPATHAAAVAAHALTTAQHLHILSDDVGCVALDAVLVGVLAGLQAAFDVDRRAFFQVLRDDLGQAAEERNTVPLGQLFLLAGVAVFGFVRGGDRDVRDGVAARHVAHLWVAAEVANDDDLVN